MAGKNGGPRPGAGRPKGIKTKCYTITLPLEVAAELEKDAGESGMTACRYIRHLVEEGVLYKNVGIPCGGKDIPGK